MPLSTGNSGEDDSSGAGENGHNNGGSGAPHHGHTQSRSHSQLVSTVQLVVGELLKAECVYQQWFDDHVEDLFSEPFLLYLASPLAEYIFGDNNNPRSGG